LRNQHGRRSSFPDPVAVSFEAQLHIIGDPTL